MDEATYTRLDAFYVERVVEQDRDVPGYQAEWDAFTALVLTHGGSLVVPPLNPEQRLGRLGDRLRVWSGTSALIVLGAPNRCHQNAAQLWLEEEAALVATGYALSDDALWRPHTWALTDDGAVIETTVARDTYAGMVLSEEETMVFAASNVPEDAVAASLRAGGRATDVARRMLTGALGNT